MYNIQPKVLLVFSHNRKAGGFAVCTYRVSDMYIELEIPHTYTFGCKNKTNLTVILIHEYCHYIDSLKIKGYERVDGTEEYQNDLTTKKLDEQRNWTATKNLAKKLGLWNRQFYAVIKECYYTTALKF